MTAPVLTQLCRSTGVGPFAPTMPIPVKVMTAGTTKLAPTKVRRVQVLVGVPYAQIDPIPIEWTVAPNLEDDTQTMPIPVVVV